MAETYKSPFGESNPYALKRRQKEGPYLSFDENAPAQVDTQKGDWLAETARSTAQNIGNDSTNLLESLGRGIVGDQEGQRRAAERYLEEQEVARQLGPKIQSFDDAEAAGGGIGNYGAALAYQGAALLPDMVSVGLGVGVGTAVGRGAARSIARRSIADAIENRADNVAARIADTRVAREQVRQAAVNAPDGAKAVSDAMRVASAQVDEASRKAAMKEAARISGRTPRGDLSRVEEAARTFVQDGIDTAGKWAGRAGGTAAGVPRANSGNAEILADEDTGQGDAVALLAGNVAGAATGVLPVERLFGRFGKEAAKQIEKDASRFLPRVAKEFGKQGMAEGSQEVVQQATQLASHAYVKQNPEVLYDAEARKQYFASFAAGFFLGGALGSAGEVGRTGAAAVRKGAGSGLRKATDLFREGVAKYGQKARDGRPAPGQEIPTDEATTEGLSSKFMRNFRALGDGVGRMGKGVVDRFRGAQSDLQNEELVDGMLADGLPQDIPNQVRDPRQNPIDFKKPMRNLLMSYVSDDSPIWQQKDAARRASVALERLFGDRAAGKEVDATDERIYNWLVESGSMPRETLVTMMGLGNVASGNAKTIELLGKDVAPEGVEAPDTAMAIAMRQAMERDAGARDAQLADQGADETERAAEGDTVNSALNERDGGEAPLPLRDRQANLRAAVIAANKRARAALTPEARQHIIDTERAPLDREAKRVSAELRTKIFGAKKTAAREYKYGANIRDENMKLGDFDEKLKEPGRVELVQKGTHTLDNGTVLHPRLALSLDSLMLQEIQENSADYQSFDTESKKYKAALFRVIGDVAQAGIQVKPETFTAGDIKNNDGEFLTRLTKRDVAQLQRKLMRGRPDLKFDKQERWVDQESKPRKERALGDGDFDEGADHVLGPRAVPEGRREPNTKAAIARRLQMKRPTSAGAAAFSKALSKRAAGAARSEFVPTQDVVTDVKMRTPYEAEVNAVRASRRGSDKRAVAQAIHEAGVRIGEAELAKQDASGAIDSKRLASELARLRDPESGVARRYFKRAANGEFDSVGFTEARARTEAMEAVNAKELAREEKPMKPVKSKDRALANLLARDAAQANGNKESRKEKASTTKASVEARAAAVRGRQQAKRIANAQADVDAIKARVARIKKNPNGGAKALARAQARLKDAQSILRAAKAGKTSVLEAKTPDVQNEEITDSAARHLLNEEYRAAWLTDAIAREKDKGAKADAQYIARVEAELREVQAFIESRADVKESAAYADAKKKYNAAKSSVFMDKRNTSRRVSLHLDLIDKARRASADALRAMLRSHYGRIKGFDNGPDAPAWMADIRALMEQEIAFFERELAARGDAKIADGAESAASPSGPHDLKAETAMLNALLDARGVEEKIKAVIDMSSGDAKGLKGGNYGRVHRAIGINPHLHGAERVEVLAHELGHHLFWNEIAKHVNGGFDALKGMTLNQGLYALKAGNPKLYAAFKADFDKWNVDRPSQSPTFRQLHKLTIGGERLFTSDAEAFHEWVADNVDRYLTQKREPVSIVGKFFKSIATQFRSAWKLLTAAPNMRPAPSIEAWVKSLFDANREAVKVVAGVSVPKKTADKVIKGAAAASAPAPAQVFSVGNVRDLITFVKETLPVEERQVLDRVFGRAVAIQKLREFWNDKLPDVVPMLDDAKAGLENRIALGYLAWQAGAFNNVGPKGTSALVDVRDNALAMMGIAGEGDLAVRVLEDIANGTVQRFHEKSKKYSVRELEARARGTRQRAMNWLAKEGPVSSALTKFWTSQYKRMHDSGIPAMREIVATLQRPQGTTGDEDRGMNVAVRVQMFRFQKQFAAALKGLDAGAQQRVLQTLQRQAAPGTPAYDKLSAKNKQAVDAIRAVFAAAHDYGNDPSVRMWGDPDKPENLAHRPYYAPVIMDVREPEAMARLVKLYSKPRYRDIIFKRFGIPSDERNAATHARLVKRLADAAAFSAADPMGGDGLVKGTRSQNFRVSQFIYDGGDAADIKELAALQTKNIDEMFARYFSPVVKAAEFRRRFGQMEVTTDDKGNERERFNPRGRLDGLLAQVRKQGGNDSDVELAENAVKAALGTYGADGSPTLKAISPALAKKFSGDKTKATIEGLQAYQNTRLLPLAILSSLVDPMGIAVRSGGDFGATWEGIRSGIRSLTNKKDAGELLRALEEIGSGDDFLPALAAHPVFDGQENNFARKVNDFVFKWNGMQSWIMATRIMAMESGHRFLLKHAAADTDQSKRYLAELSLSPADIQADPDKPGRVVLNDKTRAALNQFVDEAILRPNSTQVPLWHRDPYMGLLSQYKAFGYAIYDQISGRVSRELTHGNYRIMLAALSYAPIVIMAELLRELIQFGADGNPNRADWGPGDYVALSADRSGLLGPRADILGEIHGDVSRHNLPGTSQLGPTLGQVENIGDATTGRRDLGKEFESALPGAAAYRHWNDVSQAQEPVEA